jgi:hypothetical protein
MSWNIYYQQFRATDEMESYLRVDNGDVAED